MVKETLFTNNPKNTKSRKQEKQHLHKLATQADSKSLTVTIIARTLTPSVYHLINSQSEQDSKEVRKTFALQRCSKDVQSRSLVSAIPGIYTLPDRA
ncbi:hypothetical protein AVEN_184701-1 [Araneus ventricosus]|uniref:Uncharacterized protein n=1 Tax=Araneus ventricosus TaxID=182803 RepID=A0A4Y2RI85_ARAVE|nr:hypothetical protein AVEN_184701-1 [Araneus ventricosus]